MKFKTYLFVFGLIASSIVSTYFVTATTIAQQAAPPQIASADNEYQVSGVLYMQNAGEYRALVYQAFNFARMSLEADDKTKKKLPKTERKKPRAVVVDVDETILDNSPQQANLIKKRLPFTPLLFTEWVNKRIAKPIPGAVDFLTYANREGVKVFYVTNRNADEKQGTIDNLKSVGFPDASDETILVRADTSSKEPRRQMIEQKYRIVLLMGDNLNDLAQQFERKSIADRFAEVDKAREQFGTKFIVLPNAMYGDWESAIYEYGRLTEAQKAEKRANALQLP